MKLTLGWRRIANAVLGVCAVWGVPGQGVAGESQHSGWYVGTGAGVNWISDMKQTGWNRDTICYPNDDCTSEPPGGGYRWFYDLDADRGSMFEIAIGRRFGNIRLELSANQRKNDMDQEFTGITYLDGSAILPARSSYTSQSTFAIDDLRTRTLLLNVYYDFPFAQSRVTPYLGAGVGLSFVKLLGVFFHSEYSCTGTCSAPLGSAEAYNSRQDEDLSDTVFSKHLYAGADYSLNDRFLLGLKLSYSLVDDIRDRGRYIEHPVSGLVNRAKISDMDHWSLMLSLKYLFGG